MEDDCAGKWPWERDTSSYTSALVGPERGAFGNASESLYYTLPTVKDRRAENGRRPVTARELARLKEMRERGPDTYFRWG